MSLFKNKSVLSVFYHIETEIKKAEGTACFQQIPLENIFWVDLHFPTDDEKRKVQSVFTINFDQLKSEIEIESNTRFYETDDFVFVSLNFTALKENNFESTPVFLYLLDNVLITERIADLATFAEITRKITRNRKAFKNGSDVLEGILESKFDVDADYIEQMGKNIAAAGRHLSFREDVDIEEMVLKIGKYQEATTFSREGFVNKQRVASALLKSNAFENKERLKILIKDINTMLDYTSFIFVRLEYLQSLLNIEQNKMIKIFTIVAVTIMPPTLIASIFGMNFKYMPGINWTLGYPLAILLIIGSSLITLYIFKRKKWL